MMQKSRYLPLHLPVILQCMRIHIYKFDIQVTGTSGIFDPTLIVHLTLLLRSF